LHWWRGARKKKKNENQTRNSLSQLGSDFRAITVTDIILTATIVRIGTLIIDRTIAITTGRTMDTGDTVITATTVIRTAIIGNEMT
jgi:hypothetical protein